MAKYIEPAWCEECAHFSNPDMGGEGYCEAKDEPTWYGCTACSEFALKDGTDNG